MKSSEKKLNSRAASGREAAAEAEEEMASAASDIKSKIENVIHDESLTQEQKDKAEFDLYIELAIISHACQKHSEGGAGVIMRLNLEELSDDVRNNLLKFLPELAEAGNSETVFKYIKIYNVGIHDEFALQKQAYDIIGASDLTDFISVPRPISARKTKLVHEKTIEKLSLAGVRVSREVPNISYETMDFIDGVDLEVYFAQKLVLQRPELYFGAYPDGDLDGFISSFNNYNVRQRLQLLFGSEEAEATFSDQDKFFEFLKKRLSYGEVFSKEQLQHLKSAIKLLHERGFYHRDLHLRNVMIDRESRLYLIDYDRSVTIDPRDADAAENVYSKPAGKDQINRYLSDSWIIDFLAPLAKGKEDQASEELRATENELGLDNISRIKKAAQSKTNPRLAKAWDKMITGINEGRPIRLLVDDLSRDLAISGNWQESYNYWMAVLLEASASGRSEEVINYCREMLANEKTSNFVRKNMNILMRYLES